MRLENAQRRREKMNGQQQQTTAASLSRRLSPVSFFPLEHKKTAAAAGAGKYTKTSHYVHKIFPLLGNFHSPAHRKKRSLLKRAREKKRPFLLQ